MPKRIISYLEGGKSIRVQVLEISFIESDDSLSFKVLDFTSDLQTPTSIYISVPLPKIFKSIETIGLSSEFFDDDLYAVKYRYKIITKLISIYAKKFI